MILQRYLAAFAACLAFLAAVAPVAQAKSIFVPKDFATIQAAIDAASSGDTIEIDPGQYAGPLKLKSGITLNGKGENKDAVILSSPSKDAPVIEVSNCASGGISNLAMEWKAPRSQADIPPPVVKIVASSINIQSCRIKGGFGDGIEVTGESHSIIENCEITGNVDGIYAQGAGASVTATNNHLDHNRDDGIELRDGATGTIEGNTCEKNDNFGFNVNGAGSRAEIRRNQVRGQSKDGILISGGAAARLESNNSAENRHDGIYAHDEHTSVTLIGDTCSKNSYNGVVIEMGASATLTQVVCTENEKSGICVWMQDTSAEISDCVCQENKKDGAWLTNGIKTTLRRSKLSRNGRNGIQVNGFDTSPSLIGNRCEENKMDGIHFGKESGGEVRDNVCNLNSGYGISVVEKGSNPALENNELKENSKGDQNKTDEDYKMDVNEDETTWLFQTERFKRLEGIASRVRERKSRYPSTEWQLKFFYDYLDAAPQKDPRSTLQKKVEMTKRWVAASPESITPRVALVQALKDLGWNFRGTGYADSVTDDGWKNFYAYVGQAQAAAIEAARLPEKDPELYATWIIVGMALGQRRDQLNQILNDGLAIEPDYYPIYYAMAYNLMPRWFGSATDAEAFAAQSADRTKAIEGDGLYARIAYSEILSGQAGDYLRDFKFDYKRIKKGCEDILKTYDNPIYVKNWFCFMACIHNDRETAKVLFDQIKDDWDSYVWRDKRMFIAWGKWAHGQGDRPKLDPNQDRPIPDLSLNFPILKNPSFWGLLILTPIILILLVVFLRQQR